MREVVIRPGRVADALSLSPGLREEDRLELQEASGPDVEKALIEAVLSSFECFAGVEGEKVIAIGGLCLAGRIGIPWLVCSPEAVRHPKKLVEVGREAISRWEHLCELMVNFTHPANTVHHRWIERIGFHFSPGMVPVGPNKTPFKHFYRYKENAQGK